MFAVELNLLFITEREEQAEAIKKFFHDAQALVECSSSYFSAGDIVETERV